jgi:RNA polymerase sigma-70 factor, ECF subfamily
MSNKNTFGRGGEPDPRDYRELYEKLYEIPYRIAVRVTKNPATAEDIAQEVFVRVLLRLDSFTDEEHLVKWLALAAIRLALDDRRRNRKYLLVDEVYETNCVDSYLPHNPEPLVLKAEEDLALRELLDTLKPGYREVIRGKYLKDRSYREMADQYQVSEGVLRTRCHRALAKLRELLEAGV